ncbi:MAG: glutamine-hydrolyzing GMP synthase [Proteobacteria bacterium]|jgi:GMP synthase (glutamine-hydrolysing)|nr:glutamine-hydrolyzing GMP synthase [Pseudomonadota bacterium]
MQHDAIAVIDFGGQYAHLIATKVRQSRVLAEIRQPDDPIDAFRRYKGIILSGSPSLSSHGEDSEYTKAIYDLDVPILGFCFGHQEIAKHYGGEVIHGGREWGHAEMHVVRPHPLFQGLAEKEIVWMSHFDTVSAIGPDFEELGYSFLGAAGKKHRYAAIGSDRLRRYGFQFHPEVDDTAHGDEMIANFVLGICGCAPSWTMERYVEEQVEKIRAQVGGGSVFLLASGGVDSTVAAKLFGLALGASRLHLLHVDNGMMRKDESKGVLRMFEELGLAENLHFVDASEAFLAALSGAVEPEEKRAIIGRTFIDVFEAEAKRLGIEGHLLGQGTIYPDTIETGGTKRADTIKTHHNRVPIIEQMIAAGRVVEPLADLYKVEVRELGERLGIPRHAIWRHPFPGPGLGVRLLCSKGGGAEDEVAAIRESVAAIGARYGIEAAPLPIKSVGVKADLRSYEHPVMLSGDAPFERLIEAAGTMYKDVPGINRCVWNLSTTRPSRFEPLAATMTRKRLDLLREADHLVMEGLRRHELYDSIWQCPTVLVPLRIDGKGSELCIVRPIHSERAMTATAASLPPALVAELRDAILALPGISGLALDLTSKPPGTIEWE